MKRMAALRIKRGLSQTELAAKLKTSQANVSKWERGRAQPRYTTMVKISRALGCEVCDLV